MKTLFVSSTFRDMHYERDAIRESALPKINAEAKKYGQEISFCDLRWGINTLDLDSAEGSKKVLDVCLDRIDSCNPPMIILLGDRYGYIPDKNIIADAAHAKRLELQDLEISVTALEIEYGFLSREQKQRTLVYFRNTINAPDDYTSEDSEHAAKLNKLKSRILAIVGDNYRTYTVDYTHGDPDMTSFADTVAADVTSVLMPEWKERSSLSAFELDRQTQWNFIADRNALCRGRDKLVDRLVSEITEGNSRVTLKGESGSGKSVVFCRLACVLRERGFDVLPFVGGLTTESNDSLDVLRNTVMYLQNKLDGTPYDKIITAHCDCKADEWRALAAKYVERYCKSGRKLVIMVDAVDQLFDDDYRKSNAFIPDVNHKNFAFFATCTNDYAGLNIGSVPISEFAVAERKSVIDGITSRYGRELDATVVDTMVKLPSSNSPLYLSFLVKRLLMMNKTDYEQIGMRGGQMDAISAHQRNIISTCPTDAAEMCALLIDEAGKRINDKLISQVVEFLACSRFGLRERDLATLIGDEWNTLDFLHFIMYLGDCFMQRDDGRYDFAHKSIRHGILKTIDTKRVHAKIAAYFAAQRDDDIALHETIYHIICADEPRAFYDYTCAVVLDAMPHADELDGDNSYATAFATYLISAIEFAADDGEWIAHAVETAPIDDNDRAQAFTLAVFAFVTAEVRTALHSGASYVISKALLNYTLRVKQNELADADTLVRIARMGYSSAAALAGTEDEFAAAVSDSFTELRAAYEADHDDNMLTAYINAARQKIVAYTAEVDREAHFDEMATIIGELDEITKTRYDVEPNMRTAYNRFLAMHSKAVLQFMLGDIELADELFAQSYEYILDYAGDISDMDIIAAFEIVMSVGGMLLDGYIAYTQSKALQEDEEDDDENYLEDLFADDDEEEDDEENDEDYLDYLFSDSDDDEEDEVDEEFAAALDEFLANPDKFKGADDDGEEDDELEREMLEDYASAVFGCFAFTVELNNRLVARGRTEFGANACMAYIQLASMKIAEGDYGAAGGYAQCGEALIAEIERGGKVSADSRAMALKLKSLAIVIKANDEDCDNAYLIAAANDVLRDAENLSGNSAMSNNAIVEALATLVGMYTRKMYFDYENDCVNPDDLVQAEKLCDRIDEVSKNMPFVGRTLVEAMAAIREIIDMIKYEI